MDIKDYISSGTLELYAVGKVSEEHRREIEQILRQYPELCSELSRIKGLRESRRRQVHSGALTVENGVHQAEAVTRVRNLNPESSVRFWQIATTAAALLALVACYFAVEFRSGFGASQSALRQELDRNQQLAGELNVIRERLQRAEGTLDLSDEHTYSKTVLTGTDESAGALASVFWNRRTGEVFLGIQSLPDLSSETQYQLWVIDNENPINMGVFSATSGLLRMGQAAHASAFAITLEPTGGSIQPNTERIIVFGKTGI